MISDSTIPLHMGMYLKCDGEKRLYVQNKKPRMNLSELVNAKLLIAPKAALT